MYITLGILHYVYGFPLYAFLKPHKLVNVFEYRFKILPN